jgi:formate/nitrite transporter FocA (FNT family)
VTDYFLWNEIPTALGNLVGGFLLVALPIYYTHVRESKKRNAA